MIRVHKIALDPNDAQATVLAMHAGYARVAWNHALGQFKRGLDNGIWWDWRDLRREFNAAKTDLYPWSASHSQNPAKNAISNLGVAIAGWGGKTSTGKARKGKPLRFPKFKSKREDRSFQIDNGAGTVSCDGRTVTLPRIGRLRMREALRFAGRIGKTVVSRRGGRWFVALTVETGEELALPTGGAVVGIDMGVKTLATLSDGTAIENPAPLKRVLRKLRKLDKAIARSRETHGKTHCSNRRDQLYARRAKLHARIADIRNDCHHKVTTAIAKRAGTIVVETLHVAGMLRNHRLARALADAGMAGFIGMLAYKAPLHGATLEKVSRWFPSSKLCSACGERNRGLRLSDREWTCVRCDATHDRDFNAARNLAAAARSAEARNGRGDGVRPKAGRVLLDASVSEAPTRQVTPSELLCPA